MKFLLSKILFKKYFVLFLFFLGLIIGFSRCVPIEDLSNPNIGELTIKEQYNVSDTIFLNTVLSDNFGIDTVIIDIKPVGSLPRPWINTKRINNVGARVLDLRDSSIVIPSVFSLGEYELTLTIVDVSGLKNTVSRTFLVGADATRPEFPDVLLPNIQAFDDGTYPACRSERVPLGGFITDNVGLKLITARFEASNIIVNRTFSTSNVDSVDLATIFDNELVFPDVPNASLLTLVITAEDFDTNSRSVSIDFTMDCDTESPIIESIITNLDENINEDGEIEVIQGQELFITGGIVKDSLGVLKDVFVYFNDNLVPLISRENINISTLNLIQPNDSVLVPIPSDAQNGDVYKIKVEATDIAGNVPTIKIINIKIIPNAAPNLTELRFGLASDFIDVLSFNSNPNQPVSISAGTLYRLINRITDDLLLDSYEVNWGIENQDPITTKRKDNINNKNIFFSGTQESFTFSADENSRVDTRYTLSIYAKDILGKESQITYYFIVGN